MLRSACVVLVSFAAYGFQAVPSSADAAGEQDVYAIYSLMLGNVRTSHGPDKNERYLIAAVTSTPWPKKPCVTPPPDRKAAFNEVLADFEQRQSTPRELKRGFSIRKPYRLLAADEVRAFMGSKSVVRAGSKETVDLFPGVTDLVTLSDVYFNRDRTLALTGISLWCGSLCGLSNWKVFEKSASGKWEERPWVACTTMARTSGREIDGGDQQVASGLASKAIPEALVGPLAFPATERRWLPGVVCRRQGQAGFHPVAGALLSAILAEVQHLTPAIGRKTPSALFLRSESHTKKRIIV